MSATETVVVDDANAAHKLIGRTFGGQEIRQFRCVDDGQTDLWFEFRSGGAGYLAGVRANDPHGIEVDALPPATEWVHLDDVPGRTLPGETEPVLGVGTVDGEWIWWPSGSSWDESELYLTVVDHKVEVLVETPAPEPDTVSVREALAALVQALDGQHETYPIIGWDDDAMVKARAALLAGGDR